MWAEWCGIRRSFGFGPLAGITSHDIASDVLAHPRPEVVPGDEFKGLVVPWMPGSGVVVVHVNDFPSQCFIPGNVKTLLEGDNLVLLLPILVLFLQGSSDQLVTCQMVLSQLIQILRGRFKDRQWHGKEPGGEERDVAVVILSGLELGQS